MYAIIELGGRQWKVEPGTRLEINRIAAEVGAQHAVDRVLLAANGDQVQIGRPYLDGSRVICEVVAHRLGPKEISYHFRRRENWRKTVGHRQPLTQLLVKDIQWPGAAPRRAAAAAAPAAHAPAARPKKATASPAAAKPQARRPKPAQTKESPRHGA